MNDYEFDAKDGYATIAAALLHLSDPDLFNDPDKGESALQNSIHIVRFFRSVEFETFAAFIVTMTRTYRHVSPEMLHRFGNLLSRAGDEKERQIAEDARAKPDNWAAFRKAQNK